MTSVLHLGSLHGYEWILLALVALGPFLVAVAVVYVVRHRDADQEDEVVGD